jgi:hypothetical protein
MSLAAHVSALIAGLADQAGGQDEAHQLLTDV